MSEKTRRLFFALWPDAELRRRIAETTRIAAEASGGRRIPTENLHMTLVFLGAIPESRIEVLHRCARATPTTDFEVTLDRIVSWKRQELLCLEAADGAVRLTEWVERLRDELEREHFVLERRAFLPHVTLARDVRHKIADTILPQALRWRVQKMELVESTIGTNGSNYRVWEF